MRHRRHCGAGIVEVMVGITIALFAVLVIYVVVATAAHLRRASQSAADAQQTALFALSRLSFDIANAGNGFVAAAKALATCPASADVADTLRPVTVLIGDSGHDNAPDSIVVRYGVAPTIAGAATFAAAAPAGASFLVQSPAGFAAGDHVIAVGRNGVCAATDVTSATASSAGVIEIAHAPLAESFPASSWLVNLGARNDAQVIRYDVQGDVLRTTDVLNGDAPNPLASNIVNLKLQYGIDGNGDGTLDTWVAARPDPSGDWSAATLLAAPAEALGRIKAIRIGLIVRSDFLDRGINTAYRWTLFDCPASDKSLCPGRLSGSIAATPEGGYRYRTYETVVPLRNVVWNR